MNSPISLPFFGRGNSGHPIECSEKVLPRLPLFVENPAARGGDFVVASSALAGLLDPTSLNPAACLEAIEHRIKRGNVKLQHAFGALLDQLRDFISVPRTILHQRQY